MNQLSELLQFTFIDFFHIMNSNPNISDFNKIKDENLHL